MEHTLKLPHWFGRISRFHAKIIYWSFLGLFTKSTLISIELQKNCIGLGPYNLWWTQTSENWEKIKNCNSCSTVFSQHGLILFSRSSCGRSFWWLPTSLISLWWQNLNSFYVFSNIGVIDIRWTILITLPTLENIVWDLREVIEGRFSSRDSW